MTTTLVLFVAIFAVAVLYSSVGHAGASGYLAAMALAGMAPDEMRPTALVLNVFVASVGTWRFSRAGHFAWSTLWPFLVTALPLAMLGGSSRPPEVVYKPLVGAVLLWAGFTLIRKALRSGESTHEEVVGMPTLPMALLVGAGVGLLAGVTGTGGGIFLSPVLLVLRWATPHRTAAVSVVFVLLVSLAGLGGYVASDDVGLSSLPSALPVYVLAAIAGGSIGSGLGAEKMGGASIRVLLGVVLLTASAKMFLTAGLFSG